MIYIILLTAAVIFLAVFFKKGKRKPITLEPVLQRRPNNEFKSDVQSQSRNELNFDETFYSRNLQSEVETKFYFSLISALPDLIVAPQVALSRIVYTRGTKSAKDLGFRKISQKSLDYVVCRKDMSVVAVIEVDDSTHSRSDRVVADNTKNEVLRSANIPIIRWQARSLPSQSEIQTEFSKHLSKTILDNPFKPFNRNGDAWSKDEEKILSDGYKKGFSIDQLAEKHARSRTGVVARLMRLGIIKEDHIEYNQKYKN